MEGKNSVCGFLGGSVHLGTVPFPKSFPRKGLGRRCPGRVVVSLLGTTTYANHKNFGNY